MFVSDWHEIKRIWAALCEHVAEQFIENLMDLCILGHCINQTDSRRRSPPPSVSSLLPSFPSSLLSSTSDANYTLCPPSVSWDRSMSVFSLLTFTHRWLQSHAVFYCLKACLHVGLSVALCTGLTELQVHLCTSASTSLKSISVNVKQTRSSVQLRFSTLTQTVSLLLMNWLLIGQSSEVSLTLYH